MSLHKMHDGTVRRLNWKRQAIDPRDHMLFHATRVPVLPRAATTTTRASVPVRDQGELGSCTQNAGAAAMGFVYAVITKKPDPLFSRLFGYYFTRKLEGTPANEDSGCSVRDVFKSYKKYGLCLESSWPYDVNKFAVEPSDAAKKEALHHQAISFLACSSLQTIRASIATGWPAIFGFDCYESLDSAETAKTGLIPMPSPRERPIGGHSMFIDTYDDSAREVSGLNSWGPGWGIGGRFRMPYDYFEHGLASDAHSLRSEEV